jgi:ferrous iron transport protein A
MSLFGLHELPVGCTGEVVAVRATGLMRRRLLDLGLVPGTRVRAVRRSAAGDPIAFSIRGALVALRREDALAVLVRPLSPQGGDGHP